MFAFMIDRSAALCALSAALFCVVTTAAQAQMTSQDDVLSASLRSGWQTESGGHLAGVELQLAPEWKTYWRAPGDAGIPPRFDWSGSDNLKAVHVHWPSPSVFLTNGYLTIGYTGDVVLPIEVVPLDPSKPVHLRAAMELGVCRDICMPAFVDLETDMLPPGAPDPAIAAALATLPRPGKEAGLTGISCTIDPIADGLRVTARIDLPRLPGIETVAFETADTAVWVAEAATERQGGTLISVTELVGPGGAPFALDRSGVIVTVIHAGGSVEIMGCPAP
jgi:DsbC/DsbD-like thiol-disulfide interchange protein